MPRSLRDELTDGQRCELHALLARRDLTAYNRQLPSASVSWTAADLLPSRRPPPRHGAARAPAGGAPAGRDVAAEDEVLCAARSAQLAAVGTVDLASCAR